MLGLSETTFYFQPNTKANCLFYWYLYSIPPNPPSPVISKDKMDKERIEDS